MPAPLATSANALIKLVPSELLPLSAAEEKMLRAAAEGTMAVCLLGERDDNPANTGTWGPDRNIRAKLIRWLCVNIKAKGLVDPSGIRVYAAKITGGLDLSFVTVPFPLQLFHCRLTKAGDLSSAEIPGLNLGGSWTQAITADGIAVRDDVFLRDGFHAEGEVRLPGAQIGGQLSCSGGTFKNPPQKDAQGKIVAGTGQALTADSVDVKGNVFLSNKFHAEGEVRLLGAQIGGRLDCSGGTFNNPPRKDAQGKVVAGTGWALNADSVNVKESVFLSNKFHADGEVSLRGAQIGGQLDCSGGAFHNPPQKDAQGKIVAGTSPALNADSINVKGDISFSDGFHAKGDVRLFGAQIGGDLDCDGGKFHNPPRKDTQGKIVAGTGQALTADGVNLKGSVFLRYGFHADGEVSLPGAQIGSDLDCSGGTLNNPPQKDAQGKIVSGTGRALFADRINVKGDVFLSGKFHAEGEVFLLDAQIGGQLDCNGGTFNNPPQKDTQGKIVSGTGRALTADGVNVKDSVFLSKGFQAEGAVRLLGAQISGELKCTGGRFTTFNARTAVIKGDFFWRSIKSPRKAILILTNASVNSIYDDESSWPAQGNLRLDGFTYGRIAGGPTDAEIRLKWLALQPERPFEPQPYRQLAKVLRGAGDNSGATLVLEEMERRRRRAEASKLLAPVWSWILDESIGYGYFPGRAVWAIAMLSGLGWIIYRRAYLAGSIVPAEKDACESFNLGRGLPPNYKTFFPFIYSLENSLPLVELGQAERWQPDPSRPDPKTQDLHAARRRVAIAGVNRQPNWPHGMRWLRRGLVLVGVLPPMPSDPPPSRAGRFATSPRFLRWFLWAQILLGWILATLFAAGVTGLVHHN